MTLADPKSGGWSIGNLLTSTQMNTVRAGVIAALDGVNGGVYTLLSKLTLNGTAMFELGDKLQYGSRSITRAIPLPGAYAQTVWAFDTANLMWQTSANTASLLAIPLHLPHGATLTALSATYRGGSGHGGTMPGNKPELTLINMPVGATSGSVIGTVVDPTVSAATFETAHAITLSGLSHVVNNTTNAYFAWVKSESAGAGTATSGAYLASLTATCTVTSQSEWDG